MGTGEASNRVWAKRTGEGRCAQVKQVSTGEAGKVTCGRQVCTVVRQGSRYAQVSQGGRCAQVNRVCTGEFKKERKGRCAPGWQVRQV